MKTTSRALAALAVLSSVAAPQQYVISTYAGGAPPPTPVAALNASIGSPQAVATDADGNVYFLSLNCVFKLDSSGTLTRIAGNSRPGYSGDGGPALSAQIFIPDGHNEDDWDFDHIPVELAIDNLGNLYFTDAGNDRVRRVSAGGIITTVADAAITTNAASLSGVAVDGTGDLYISDSPNSRVLKVSSAGIVTAIAGNGSRGYSGDGGPATSAQLSFPYYLAVDAAGNLYIEDGWNVRKVSPVGIITTVEGIGSGFSPRGLAVDSAGNLYIAQFYFGGSLSILRVSLDGIVATVVANVPHDPFGIAVDGAGNLYFADSLYLGIYKVAPDGNITRVAGNGAYGYSGDGGPASKAQLDSPTHLAVDTAGNLYISDSARVLRKVSATGLITTVAGVADGGPATRPQFYVGPVAADNAGNLYIGDNDNARVRKVSPAGIITTFAGNGTPGYSGDGGLATSAQLTNPDALAVDGAGNLYISDFGNGRIRKVSTTGIITTVAGGGSNLGDGVPATSAKLWGVLGLAVDNAGTLYTKDTGGLIRKVAPDGTIVTVAQLSTGYGGLALDHSGNLYSADPYRAGISMISPAGIVSRVAGNGTPGYSGDGGVATSAQLNSPNDVAVDSAGNVYVADAFNHVVRFLQPISSSLAISALRNAASNIAGPIAPGEIVVINGSQLGPSNLVAAVPDSDGTYGKELAGTTVRFNGTPAPLIYTWATQVAAIVPYSVSGGTAQVTVNYQNQTSAFFSAQVDSSAPAIFTLDSTGQGQAAAVNQDGSINTAARPAKAGEIISLYATGEGQTSPAGVDGKPASPPLPHPILQVAVTIGGIPAKEQYAGGVQGLIAGLMQVNVQIPSEVQPGGSVPVVLQVGDRSTTPGAVWIAVAGN